MIACYNSNYDYVHIIINLGADFKILDKDNKNALFFAVDSNSSRIAKYLILLGINKNQLDKRNRKAVSYSSDKGIHHILDDHNLFDLLFKCPIVYQSLRGHITHIYYLSLLALLIVIHFLMLILFNTSGKTDKCNQYFYTVRFSSETFIMIMTLITEAFGILFYFYFHYMHKKITSVVKINITNDGEEKLYKLYLSNKNFCVKCKKIMSIGTQHCIACDKCIDNWDHHCFWLNVCIDDKNKKYFKFFMIQLFVIIFMNFIMSVFCLCDLIIFPKIYYAFTSECAEDQSFTFISIIILIIFIIYFVADIYFLYVALLPFFVEYLCISNEIEKTIRNNKEIKDSPLLHEDDNAV
jgi:predicted membrane protein